MKKNGKNRWFRILLLGMVFLSGCGNQDGNYNFANIEPKDIDPWIYLADTSISANAAVRSIASSAAELAITIGIMGIAFSLIIMALRICFTKNPAQREEIKQEGSLKAVIAIMLFSIPFWLGLLKKFSELLL